MQGYKNLLNRSNSAHKLLKYFPQHSQVILQELLESKTIDEQQLDIITNEFRKTKRDLPSILVQFGFIKKTKIQEILRSKYNIEEIKLSNIIPDINLLKMVHKNTMITNGFVPFRLQESVLDVAITNPKDTKVQNIINISFPKKYKIRFFYAHLEDINYFISTAFIIAENRLAKAVTAIKESEIFSDNERSAGSLESNVVVGLVNSLLEDATLRGASDIHIEPQENFIRVRYRIDGKLMNVLHIYKRFWNQMTIRIKVMSAMNIAETRLPQDGRIELFIAGKGVDYRLSCQPGIYGEKFVIRILDKSKSLMSLEELGFSPWNMEKIKTTISRPSGITIVTGPTGSGKTTTLYSMLGYINNVDVNIMTLEDPIEYTIPLVFQTQVKDNSKFDFATGIRSSMRQDPDILLVGEIRDHSTAETTVRASLTGHKVLTTLHTIDATTTIQRFVDIGIDRYMIAGNIDTIIAQRLVRKLCPSCKTLQTEFSKDEEKVLNKHHGLVKKDSKIYQANGCEHCNGTGYRGRTTIAEILHISPEIDDAILNSSTKHKIISIAKTQGFITLQEDALMTVFGGKTSLNEVMGVISFL